jgi:hypothetical protein
MLARILNIYYLVIDFFSETWRGATNSSGKWWDSRYR